MSAIDLALPRTVPIQDRGHTYLLEFAPITKTQWLDYFSRIEHSAENVDGKVTEVFNATSARLNLVSQSLVGALGYRVPGGGPLMDLPNWREQIPMRHLLGAGMMLTAVERSTRDTDVPLMLGLETVTLDANWIWDGASGINQSRDLVHSFSTPTLDQQRRYSRDASRSQTLGGSRTGKTLWRGAQPTLADLYDELIQVVSGYVVNGEPIADREAIIRNMDTYHKVIAAEALFSPAAPAITEKE